MKLPMPTPGEIYEIANRASGNLVSARSVNTLIIENAIRTALNTVIERLNIQVSDSLHLNLNKD